MKTSNVPKSLASLYAQVMLHYRQPKGDAAWSEIEKLIGVDNTASFSFLMGWVNGRQMNGGLLGRTDWLELQQLTTPKTKKKNRKIG